MQNVVSKKNIKAWTKQPQSFMNKLLEKSDGQHNPGCKEAKLKENTILKVSIYVECRAYWKPTLLANA